MGDRDHDSLVDGFSEFGDRLRGDRWQPDVDVYETESALVVRAEIAGVRREDLNVKVDGQVLRIAGIRRATGDGGELRRLHQIEIASGPFERRVKLPVAFERGRVTAHVENGFLTVTLPKRDARPRRVPVTTR